MLKIEQNKIAVSWWDMSDLIKDLAEKIGTILSILLKKNSDISTEENETTENTQSLSKVAS